MKEKLPCIEPFANEYEIITIQTFSIENRFDQISIYGVIDITKDKNGLEKILALKHQIDTIANYLKHEDLDMKVSAEKNSAKNEKKPF